MAAPLSTIAPSGTRAGWSSLGELTGYQWFVFLVASMAWTLDCMDQQFFNLARRPAMMELVQKPAPDDPRINDYATNNFKETLDPKNPDDLKKSRRRSTRPTWINGAGTLRWRS
jgi:hypothetical protein